MSTRYLKQFLLIIYSRATPGRGVSEKVSAVGFCLDSGLFGSCNSDYRLLAKSWNHIVNKPFIHIIGTYWFIKYKGFLKRNTKFLPMYTN